MSERRNPIRSLQNLYFTRFFGIIGYQDTLTLITIAKNISSNQFEFPVACLCTRRQHLCSQHSKSSHRCRLTTIDRCGNEVGNAVDFGHEKTCTTDKKCRNLIEIFFSINDFHLFLKVTYVMVWNVVYIHLCVDVMRKEI